MVRFSVRVYVIPLFQFFILQNAKYAISHPCIFACLFVYLIVLMESGLNYNSSEDSGASWL